MNIKIKDEGRGSVKYKDEGRNRVEYKEIGRRRSSEYIKMKEGVMLNIKIKDEGRSIVEYKDYYFTDCHSKINENISNA